MASDLSSATKMVFDHPKTLVLGGLIAYVAFGLITIPKGNRRKAYFRPITAPLSLIVTVVGFGASIVDDVQDAIQDGRTKVWQQALDALQMFLKESGLDDEFSSTLSSPRILTNLMVLTDLQNKIQRQRRKVLRQVKGKLASKKEKNDPIPVEIDPDDIKLGQHYMRYATAVYGAEMMTSVQLALFGEVKTMPNDSNHTCVDKHCLLEENRRDIWCDYSRDPTNESVNHALHTLVVCDHENKVVVLAIRGTFSLSGVITDLAGFCEEFCGGWAHSGMALAAKETWDGVWNSIMKEKMKTLPADYKLVLTGHSLGAGVACLVTILIHHQIKQLPELKGRSVHCYAHAPPPVFAPMSAAPDAVANTIAYIHQYDIVPSLSVDAIRQFMECLDRIDAVMAKNPVWEVFMERWESGEPQPELVESYEKPKGVARRALDNAPMLFIPARQLIWMEKDPEYEEKKTDDDACNDGREFVYLAHALDPTLYADRVLDLEIPDCVANHMTPEYEVAFASVVETL